MKLIALAIALVARRGRRRAQRDTVKRDTVRGGTAEKVGRQTGTSVDKAAKTTQPTPGAGHDEDNASHAASATKTGASHGRLAERRDETHLADATRPAPVTPHRRLENEREPCRQATTRTSIT
jgi:hypothetical protein